MSSTSTSTTSSTSNSRSSSPSSNRRCSYGYSNCRGGRRCQKAGHQDGSLELLISSMTLMMRSQFEIKEQERVWREQQEQQSRRQSSESGRSER